MRKFYTASDLAKISGISRQTLIKYEKMGVISPAAHIGLSETPVYDESAVEAIVKRLKDKKFQNYNLPRDIEKLKELLQD